ncbi:ARM repeat-containing protein [Lichtheimia hyalospora FSU 10163]|nr:ARM repeat-containing protein [Lichtheimia hyalospora FSU 10163]
MDIDRHELVFESRLITNRLITAELIPKLETLHGLLRAFDQDLVNKDSLNDVAKELVHPKIMRHSSESVRALAACCLADILRLYAPDAPYNDTELKSIFQLFISEIKHLDKPQDPNFERYFYLIESLSSVKSIVIIGDLDNAEELTTQFVKTFYELGDANVTRNILVCMTDLMVLLVDESESLSEDVIEMTLGQIQKYMDSPEMHNTMALDLACACTDVMQRHVCQYFSDALMAMSKSDGSTEDIEELQKVHRLIQKVHSVVPDLLLNVVPQLEEEMKVDDFTIRLLATETIGGMLCEKRSNLHQRYPSVWKTWLGRRNDKAVQLRIKWIESAANIFESHYFAIATLNEYLKARLLDPEEKVRAAVCRVIGEMNLDHVIDHVDMKLLQEIAERCKDKKSSVRKAAMSTLGSLYSAAYPRIQDHNESAISKLGWIPENLLYCVYVDDVSVIALVEKTLHEYIFPPMDDDQERTKRLVSILGMVNERAKLGFIHIIRKQKSLMSALRRFLDACKQSNEDMEVDNEQVDHSQIEMLATRIAATFPESSKVSSAMQSFSDILVDDQDIREIFEACIDPNNDYVDIRKSQRELASSLQAESSSIQEILQPVLRRACPTLINKGIIPHLFSIVSSQRPSRRSSSATRSKHAVIAQELLTEISQTFPAMYDSFLYNLVSTLTHSKNDHITRGALELLSQVVVNGVKIDLEDQALLDQLVDIAQGQDIELARYASIVLCHMNAVDVCGDVIQVAANNLSSSFIEIAASLTSLAQFALYMPVHVVGCIDNVSEFIFEKLMTYETKKNKKSNPEWLSYDHLDDSSKAKIAGLELLINYLAGTTLEIEPKDELVKEIFERLFDYINSSADTAFADGTSAAELAHLRLTAVKGALKLTHMEQFESQLSVERFEQMCLILQDSCYQVREQYAKTLIAGLKLQELHHRYLSSLFLMAHEVESDLLKQVKYFIEKWAAKHKSETNAMEASFMQLIHILAHHPDFSVSNNDLALFMRYLQFFISCIATPDNVASLYHVTQKIKLAKDVRSNDQSEYSYYLCDLAAFLINRKCKDASWPLNLSQETVHLQSKLYKTLPSGAVQTETIKKSYLPDSFITWLEQHHDKGGDKRMGQPTVENGAAAKRTRTS